MSREEHYRQRDYRESYDKSHPREISPRDKHRSRSPKPNEKDKSDIRRQELFNPDIFTGFSDNAFPPPAPQPPTFRENPPFSSSSGYSAYSGIYSDFPSMPPAPHPPEITWNQLPLASNLVGPPPPPMFSLNLEEQKKKKNAALESERHHQRVALSEKREDYIKKSNGLKKELDTLKDQWNDLRGDSKRSPSPDTKKFLKDNTKLQLKIQNKLKEITDVVDMLNNIIGEQAHNVSSSTESAQKMKPKYKSPTRFNYVYYDPEMHWCRICNEFPTTAKDYLNHLHSPSHHKMASAHVEAPWHSLPSSNEGFPFFPSASNKRTPIKGLQFFVPSTAWYCKLCDQFIGDLHCASAHLKSVVHSKNYSNFVEQNPHWETDWMSDRQKSLEKAARSKVVGEKVEEKPTYTAHTIKFSRDGFETKDKNTPPLEDEQKDKKRKFKKKNKKRRKESSSSSDSSSEEEVVKKNFVEQNSHFGADWMSDRQKSLGSKGVSEKVEEKPTYTAHTIKFSKDGFETKDKNTPPLENEQKDKKKKFKKKNKKRRKESSSSSDSSSEEEVVKKKKKKRKSENKKIDDKILNSWMSSIQMNKLSDTDRKLFNTIKSKINDNDVKSSKPTKYTDHVEQVTKKIRESVRKDDQRQIDGKFEKKEDDLNKQPKKMEFKKMPFIGKMPVYKCLGKITKNEELSKEEQKKKDDLKKQEEMKKEEEESIRKKREEILKEVKKNMSQVLKKARRKSGPGVTLPPPGVALPTTLSDRASVQKDFQDALNIIFPTDEMTQLSESPLFNMSQLPTLPLPSSNMPQPTNNMPHLTTTMQPSGPNFSMGMNMNMPPPFPPMNVMQPPPMMMNQAIFSRPQLYDGISMTKPQTVHDNKKKEEMDDLAMLGIDASDVGSGL